MCAAFCPFPVKVLSLQTSLPSPGSEREAQSLSLGSWVRTAQEEAEEEKGRKGEAKSRGKRRRTRRRQGGGEGGRERLFISTTALHQSLPPPGANSHGVCVSSAPSTPPPGQEDLVRARSKKMVPRHPIPMPESWLGSGLPSLGLQGPCL